jgi:hypothetical protein
VGCTDFFREILLGREIMKKLAILALPRCSWQVPP